MPRPTSRPPPVLEDLLGELRTLHVENLPDVPPDVPERRVVSVLAFALYYAQRLKTVRFPSPVDWDSPSFVVADDHLTVRVAWTMLDGMADLADVLAERAEAEADAGVPVMLAVDAMDSDATEYELEHALYGSPVMLAFRVRPPRTRDPRIPHALERGWKPTLYEHNLVPGRSLHIPDNQFGLFLTHESARHLAGVHFLLPNGHFTMELNPFVKDDVNDPAMQDWLQWGRGGPASEWHDVLVVDGEPTSLQRSADEPEA